VNNVHRRLSKRDEKGVNKVWRKNFKGYSGEFGKETIDEILQSEDVCPDTLPLSVAYGL